MFRLKSSRKKSVQHSQEFFHMLIVGRSGCGKTRYLLDLLRGEFLQKFNAIFLICPTFSINQSYHDFSSDENFFVLPQSIEHIEQSIEMSREEATKYFRSLIIFDDVIGVKTLHSRTSLYVRLLVGGRHDGISTITLTQQLTSISKPARDQMTRVVSFYNADADDRRILFDKYLFDTTREERGKIVQFLRSKDYAKVDINILHGTYQLVP